MIKIEQKNIDVTLENSGKSVVKTSDGQSIGLDNTNFSIDCETLEVSATPIIFNQVINNSGDSNFTWLIVSSNTGVVTNTGYIAINNLTIINFNIAGIFNNGDKLAFFNMGSGGLRISKDGIIFGDKVTLANGYLESLNYGDYIYMVYLNNKWVVQQSMGNINTL